MPIHALSPATVRLLGSAQLITDPTSAVKELIDNALDAQATAVFVTIAPNSVDSLQVRDNGHGVASDDRAALCRPHFTSKLGAFDELTTVGGRTLGFRGDALSCLAELAGTLRIITRVAGDPMATELHVDRKGEICR